MEIEDFGKRLVELRMDKGVSARDMSLSIGQNHGYINDIENGHACPTMEKFFYICDYLGITPQEFFDLETPDPIKTKRLYQETHSLSSRQLDILLAVAREMKK